MAQKFGENKIDEECSSKFQIKSFLSFDQGGFLSGTKIELKFLANLFCSFLPNVLNVLSNLCTFLYKGSITKYYPKKEFKQPGLLFAVQSTEIYPNSRSPQRKTFSCICDISRSGELSNLS